MATANTLNGLLAEMLYFLYKLVHKYKFTLAEAHVLC